MNMPLVSVGGKGPPGPPEAKGWSCVKCQKILSRRDALREHCLRKHAWCIDTGTEATPEVLEAFRQKSSKAAQRRKTSGSGQPGEQDLFGSTSDLTEEQDDTVEPTTAAVPESPIAPPEPVSETVVDLTGEVAEKPPDPPTSCKDGNKKVRRKTMVRWTTTPLPVIRGHPCVRKRLELSRPPCPIKQYLKMRGMKASNNTASSATQQRPAETEPRPGPSVSEGIASLIDRAVVTEGGSGPRELLVHTGHWPERGRLPSVRDVVAYRRTVPRDTTPREIGDLAALKFGWTGEPTVTSAQYVKGVVAGHDHARRTLIDDLSKYMA